MQKINLIAGNVLGYVVLLVLLSAIWTSNAWEKIKTKEIKPWELVKKGV